MNSVLFVSELGGGFGHVRRLLPMLRTAIEWGYGPILFVQNPLEAVQVVTSESVEVRKAPTSSGWRGARPGHIACTFADMLGRHIR
jgi:hypothetical protein